MTKNGNIAILLMTFLNARLQKKCSDIYELKKQMRILIVLCV